MSEQNAGYTIIAGETYSDNPKTHRQDSVVLGLRFTLPDNRMYVTWERTSRELDDGNIQVDYYWGHYFEDFNAARLDYHKRLVEKYGG